MVVESTTIVDTSKRVVVHVTYWGSTVEQCWGSTVCIALVHVFAHLAANI